MTFMQACREAGVMDFHFYDLRHTMASWMRQRGAPRDLMQKQLGHKDLRMLTLRLVFIRVLPVGWQKQLLL